MTPQDKTILAHLQDRTITVKEAISLYGIYRLSARIYNLRRSGFNISSHLILTSDRKRFARYQLIK
jgi:hypothetical protein